MNVVLKGLQTIITLFVTYSAYTALQDENHSSLRTLPDNTDEAPSTTFFGVKNFTYVTEPVNTCTDEHVLFLILVHSDPTHFVQRSTIRSTWGSLTGIVEPDEEWKIKLVFLLGQSKQYNQKLNDMLEIENTHNRDILTGSFVDSYHNLTYKHLMGYQWSSHCPNVKFVMKADDDAFVDVPGLYHYLVRSFGNLTQLYCSNFLAGNVFPYGTHPKRQGKWAVSLSAYPSNTYPMYLGGLAYLVTPDVIENLLRAAQRHHTRYLWVDDVYITGILAASLHLHPFYLNLRYAYEESEITKWLRKAKSNLPPPYIFIHLNTTKPKWTAVPRMLWSHVRRSYSISTNVFNAGSLKRRK